MILTLFGNEIEKGNLGWDDFWWHSYSDINIEHHYH